MKFLILVHWFTLGSSSGIELQAMDSSHVVLSRLELNLGFFEFYRCTTNISLGINVRELLKILSCSEQNDALTLEAAENVDFVNVVLSAGEDETEFDLKLVNANDDSLEIPVMVDSLLINEIFVLLFKLCFDIAGKRV